MGKVGVRVLVTATVDLRGTPVLSGAVRDPEYVPRPHLQFPRSLRESRGTPTWSESSVVQVPTTFCSRTDKYY